MTRVSEVPLSNGATELIFKEITPNLDPQKLVVKADNGITILSVKHQLKVIDIDKKNDTIKQLTAQRFTLLEQLEVDREMLMIVKQGENMLQKNQQLTSTQSTLKTSDLKEAVDYQQNKLTELMQKRLDLQRKVKENEEKLVNVNEKLKALHLNMQGSKQRESEIIVLVQSEKAQTAHFELNYIVGLASWKPMYDLRVKDANTPFTLNLKAVVWQETGEDWRDVQLSFLAQRIDNNTKTHKKINKWNLDFLREEAVPAQYGTVTETVLDEPATDSAEAQFKTITKRDVKEREKKIRYIGVKESLLTQAFEVTLPYTVLSDAKANTISIKTDIVRADYKYYCTPKISNDVFLTAEIAEWEKYNLLEASTNLFFENTFLGTTDLNLSGTNDTLKISLGKDPNILVNRNQLTKFTKNTFLSDKREDSRAFEITLRNNKAFPIYLVVADQIPVSNNKKILVNHELKSGELNQETGIITWRLTLQSGQEQKHEFKYIVRYPQNQAVSLE